MVEALCYSVHLNSAEALNEQLPRLVSDVIQLHVQETISLERERERERQTDRQTEREGEEREGVENDMHYFLHFSLVC